MMNWLFLVLGSLDSTLGTTAIQDSLVVHYLDSIIVQSPKIQSPVQFVHATNPKFNSAFLRSQAAAMADPLRALKSAGVVGAQNDLSLAPMLRSSETYESQIFWDGVPVLRPLHLLNLFSIFPMEGTQQSELFLNSVPAHFMSTTSGALNISPKWEQPQRELSAGLDMMRGDLNLSLPFKIASLPIEFGVYSQSVWYNYFLQGFSSLVGLMGNDSSSKILPNYLDMVQIPNAMDVQWNLQTKGQKWRLRYAGIRSWDSLALKDLNEKSSHELLKADTLNVLLKTRMNSWLHLLTWHYQLNSSWVWGIKTARQDALLKSVPPQRGYEYSKFYENDKSYWAELFTQWQNDKHQTQFGIQSYWKRSSTENRGLDLSSWVLFQNGSLDYRPMLSAFKPAGSPFAVDGYNSGIDLATSFKMNQKSLLEYREYALYGMDLWNFAPLWSLEWALRLPYWQMQDRVNFGLWPEFLPSFKLSWQAHPQHLLSSGMSLQSQADFPYGIWEYADTLKSSKALNTQANWNWRLNSKLNLSAELWGKYQWHKPELYSSELIIDPTQANYFRGWYIYYWLEDLQQLEKKYAWKQRTTVDHSFVQFFDDLLKSNNKALRSEVLAQIPDSIWAYYEYRAEKKLYYKSDAKAWLQGLKLALEYQKTPWGSGRIQGEWTHAEIWSPNHLPYEASNNRPWQYHWYHEFAVSSQQNIGWHLNYAAGRPYTPYEIYRTPYAYQTLEGKSITDTNEALKILPRNSARYQPYFRLDLSWHKKSTWGPLQSETYLEIWNALNIPNLFLRNENTQQVANFDLNIPIPFIFGGYRVYF